MEGYHKSVLLQEAVDALGVKSGNWYLDCTLGDGGHTLEIIKRGGKVIGFDVDPMALERVRERLRGLGLLGNVILIQGNFRDINNLIEQTDTAGIKFAEAKSNLAGAIFDLGVSSLQLETPERGFSFGMMGPLDMRMDPSLQVTALDLLKVLSRKELYELFFNLGEEKYSKKLADALVRAGEVKTTRDLANLVESVYKRAGITESKVHPATRVFQALRIAVNDELQALQEGLEQVKELIQKNGCIVVISFHSLEDRIVKNTFKEWKLKGFGEVLTKKPMVPTQQGVVDNPRARSAKMRVFRVI